MLGKWMVYIDEDSGRVDIAGVDMGSTGEIVEYLPGATPPILVIKWSGGSHFVSRGQQGYHSVSLNTVLLDSRLQYNEQRKRFEALGETLVSVPVRFTADEKAKIKERIDREKNVVKETE